jgi:hypothetical protein
VLFLFFGLCFSAPHSPLHCDSTCENNSTGRVVSLRLRPGTIAQRDREKLNDSYERTQPARETFPNLKAKENNE